MIQPGPNFLDEDKINAQAAKDEQYKALLAETLIDPANPPPEDRPILNLRLSDGRSIVVSREGNITAICALPKAGKTALVTALVAAVIGGENPHGDTFSFYGSNRDDRPVIVIDTEQSRSDVFKNDQRCRMRAGLPLDKGHPALLMHGCTGKPSTVIRGTCDYLRRTTAVSMLVLDGVADLAKDVNDPGEAQELVAELHSLAIERCCAVVCILHVNAQQDGKTGKTRGHLGSQLERKAERNLRLHKDADGTSTVSGETFQRGAPIPAAFAPRFVWCDHARMHISAEPLGTVQKREALESAALVFAADATLTTGQMQERLMRVEGIGKSMAEKKISLWRKLEVIDGFRGQYHIRRSG